MLIISNYCFKITHLGEQWSRDPHRFDVIRNYKNIIAMKCTILTFLALFTIAFGQKDDGRYITYHKDSHGGVIVIATHNNETTIVCIKDANGHTVNYDLMTPRNQKITMDIIYRLSNGGSITIPTNYERPISFQAQQEGKNGASSSPFGGGGWSFSGLKDKVFKFLGSIINKILSGTKSNVRDGCGQLGDVITGGYGGTYPVLVDFGREEFNPTSFDAMRDQVRPRR